MKPYIIALTIIATFSFQSAFSWLSEADQHGTDRNETTDSVAETVIPTESMTESIAGHANVLM